MKRKMRHQLLLSVATLYPLRKKYSVLFDPPSYSRFVKLCTYTPLVEVQSTGMYLGDVVSAPEQYDVSVFNHFTLLTRGAWLVGHTGRSSHVKRGPEKKKRTKAKAKDHALENFPDANQSRKKKRHGDSRGVEHPRYKLRDDASH